MKWRWHGVLLAVAVSAGLSALWDPEPYLAELILAAFAGVGSVKFCEAVELAAEERERIAGGDTE